MRAAAPKPVVNPWQGLFAAALGGLLGLALVKFGNPVILDRKVIPPTELIEFILLPWPIAWGYMLLALVAAASFAVARPQTHMPKWAVTLPLVWLVWQGLAAIGSVAPELSRTTLLHFASCAVCFYLGMFALSRVERRSLFWLGLLAGFFVVVVVGWQQHFGGLEETRRYFYALPDWRKYPPEFLKKISSNRVYSTLFYPNTLAGVILLLLPISSAVIWESARTWRLRARVALTVFAGLPALACLYWSESKAGWLIFLGMGLVAFTQLPLTRKAKRVVVTVALVVGLAGFFIKFSGYFERGATSVSARFDYWRAAGQLVKEHPLVGTGPGTFQVGYKRLKPPGAEMARLAHNDYLQQASDSGIPGLALYLAMMAASLAWLYPRREEKEREWRFAVWLGLVGMAAQSMVEFPLYLPALSWPMFVFLGWLWGTTSRTSTQEPASR